MMEKQIRMKVKGKLMRTNLIELQKTTVIICFMILFTLSFQNCSVKETTYQKVENAEHVVVYYEEGKFLGWPANNGAWSADGVNMLVGFIHGDYKLTKGNHNIGGNQKNWLARSSDMGQTWKGYDPDNFVGDFGEGNFLWHLPLLFFL